MHNITRVTLASVLALAYLAIAPVISAVAYDASSGKAYADSRDVGHKSGDKGKQDSGKVSTGN